MARGAQTSPLGNSRARAARRLLVLWILVLLLVLLPWWSVTDHPHWYKVGWIPFLSTPFRPFDIVANVLLFVPYGWLAGLALASRRRAWTLGLAGAALLSVAAEYTQVYSHSRFPSATDVVCNLAGAAIGLWRANSSNSNDSNNSS